MAKGNKNTDNKIQSNEEDYSIEKAGHIQKRETYKSGQGVYQEPVGSIEDNPFSPENSQPDTPQSTPAEPKQPQESGDSESEG